MWLFTFKCFAIFMVPLGAPVTFNIFVWTTFIPFTLFTHRTFIWAFFVFIATFVFCCICKLRGDLNISTWLFMSFFLECWLIHTSYILLLFLFLQVWKRALVYHHKFLLVSVLVSWVISPLVLAPPLLHSRSFSNFLCSLSAFHFSFASLYFLILSNFSSWSLMFFNVLNNKLWLLLWWCLHLFLSCWNYKWFKDLWWNYACCCRRTYGCAWQGFIQAILMYVKCHKKLNLAIEFWNSSSYICIFVCEFVSFCFCLIHKVLEFICCNILGNQN